ncbi:MAG: restriction endonuclease [Caldisericota bacterium]|nr:restriction endonuclease [Caldisericota bacterium]
MQSLQIDFNLRNTNNPHNPKDVFNRFFRFGTGTVAKGINNTSGFRPKSTATGSTDIEACAFCVLVTTFDESEWPDSIDLETGLFTYFGDKREKGDLHDTTVGGNRLLRSIYEKLHQDQRTTIPPFLIFESRREAEGMVMRFLGLAAPGANGMSSLDDLVAVWRVHKTTRFQNYRAIFTVLRESEIPRMWLEDMVAGAAAAESEHCPATWKQWVMNGLYSPLVCERKKEPRDRESQLPSSKSEMEILEKLRVGLNDRQFEFAAAEIVRLMDDRFSEFTVTPRVRDHGRDAIGTYRVGHDHHQVLLDAIVEAKLWSPAHGVGVKPMSRLISRLKHRDIGVFVTTTYFNKQVQEELLEDRHPIILVSGGDISKILMARDFHAPGKLEAWLGEIAKHS